MVNENSKTILKEVFWPHVRILMDLIYSSVPFKFVSKQQITSHSRLCTLLAEPFHLSWCSTPQRQDPTPARQTTQTYQDSTGYGFEQTPSTGAFQKQTYYQAPTQQHSATESYFSQRGKLAGKIFPCISLFILHVDMWYSSFSYYVSYPTYMSQYLINTQNPGHSLKLFEGRSPPHTRKCFSTTEWYPTGAVSLKTQTLSKPSKHKWINIGGI